MGIIDKARAILSAVNTARRVENSITGAELSGTGLQSAWRRMADALGNADHFAELFVDACKESGTGKEADVQTEKNGRTWNRDLQFADGKIGEAIRSGNMKTAKDYFDHLKTLRNQLKDEIEELQQTLALGNRMVSERSLQLSTAAGKEASEKWKPPTPEELLASYTTEAEDYIAKMARAEKRIASGQPASPSSILQVTSAADSLRLSINKLSDPAAKALSKRLRDGIKSLLSASDAELKRGSVDGPYRAVYKEAPERPMLPSGRYADVDPGRLMGRSDE